VRPEQNCSHPGMQVRRDLQVVRNNSMKTPLNTSRAANTRRRQRRIPMELILIIVVVLLLFGGGGYWGRRRGHW
jgi:cobalamin biosynthesis Mg chelatase CobN